MSFFSNNSKVNQLSASLAEIATYAPNGTDDTANIQTLLDAGKIPRLQTGTYIISTLTLNDNAKIISSGYATILQQKTGTPASTPIVNIKGSNVVIDEMTYIGIISTGTGEWNHAVQIMNTTKSITNIQVKGINAQNIRGDGLYIGGNTNYNPQNIAVGDVYATNCYRNGVSLTGGINVTIGNITSLNCGVLGLDLETDTQGGHNNNIKIGNVVTSNICISAAGTGYPFTENVQVGFVECRRTRLGSTPAYPTVLDTNKDGCTFRNARNIKIQGLDVSGFDRFAIQFLNGGSDRYSDNIEIEFLTVATCSQNDTTYNSYVNMAGVNTLKVKNVTSTTQTGKYVFRGSSNTDTNQNIIIEKATHTGDSFASYCGMYAKNINAQVTGNAVLSSLKSLSRIETSTLNGVGIIGYSTNVLIENCNLTYSSYKETGGTNIYRSNIINGTYTA